MHVRRTVSALALVAALAATAAACGDDDDAVQTDARTPAAADVAGSDQHLQNMSSEAERVERANAAATARLAAEAERQATLDGNAETYGKLSADAASGLAEAQSAYQAGAAPVSEANRAAQRAAADAYVELQQQRADEADASNVVEAVGSIFG